MRKGDAMAEELAKGKRLLARKIVRAYLVGDRDPKHMAVIYEDGAADALRGLCRIYSWEWESFNPDDYVGLTKLEAMSLFLKKYKNPYQEIYI